MQVMAMNQMGKQQTCRLFLVVFTICFLQALSAAQSWAGQTSAKEVRTEVADAAETIKDYTVDQRDEAVAKIESILNDLDDRIDRLGAEIDENWDQMTAAAQQEAREALAGLRKQRNEVAEWFGGLKHSSAGAWEELKNGFSDAYNRLARSWQQAENEFDSGKE